MSNRIADLILNSVKQNPQRTHAASDSTMQAEEYWDQSQKVIKKIENVVTAYPAVAVGVAVAAGIAFGWWVKRK